MLTKNLLNCLPEDCFTRFEEPSMNQNISVAQKLIALDNVGHSFTCNLLFS